MFESDLQALALRLASRNPQETDCEAISDMTREEFQTLWELIRRKLAEDANAPAGAPES